MIDIDETKSIWKTYELIRKLSSINGSDVSKILLDRVMYNVETLPPLGKEYWWFLFFGKNGKKPVQVMFLIFRKQGKSMLFNGKKVMLKRLTKNQFQAVTAGWVYDGKNIQDLGDTNSITTIYPEKKLISSEISGQKMILSGGFPHYKLKLGDLIDLNISKGDYPDGKDACGIFIPPFGTGWIDIFSDVEGIVLEKKFEGTAHLQKVVGIMPFGPFHWGRIVFRDGSSTSFFCLKTGEKSRKYFYKSIVFHNNKTKKIIKFNNPKLRISKKDDETPIWIVEGKDDGKEIKIVLEVYATKQFTMEGGGSQVYIEYLVIPKEFYLRSKDREIVLNDLGSGVGTFEDAYGLPI